MWACYCVVGCSSCLPPWPQRSTKHSVGSTSLNVLLSMNGWLSTQKYFSMHDKEDVRSGFGVRSDGVSLSFRLRNRFVVGFSKSLFRNAALRIARDLGRCRSTHYERRNELATCVTSLVIESASERTAVYLEKHSIFQKLRWYVWVVSQVVQAPVFAWLDRIVDMDTSPLTDLTSFNQNVSVIFVLFASERYTFIAQC